jgi:glutathione peroxidase-family protein
LTQGTNDEIFDFGKKYGADQKFVYFDKGHVNGKDSREVYSFLKHKIPAADGTTDIRWNFATFLVDHEGNPHARFDPSRTVGTILAPVIDELIAKKERGDSSTN